MGGKALKHLGVKRVDTRQLVNVFNRLNRVANMDGTKLSLVPWIETKDDHGDIDILTTSHLDVVMRFLITMRVDVNRASRNGEVLSVSVPIDPYNAKDCVQVDFISVSPPNLPFTMAYFSGGDFGALIGKLAYQLGFVFAMDGFRVRCDPERGLETDVPLSMSLSEAMSTLGYRTMPNELTFRAYEDLWAYVMSSGRARPWMFTSDATNADNRSRDKQRVAVGKFQEWLANTYEPGAMIVADRRPASGVDQIPTLSSFHQDQIVKVLDEREKNKTQAAKITAMFGRGAVESVFAGLSSEDAGRIIHAMQPALPPKNDRVTLYEGWPDAARIVGISAAREAGVRLGFTPKQTPKEA